MAQSYDTMRVSTEVEPEEEAAAEQQQRLRLVEQKNGHQQRTTGQSPAARLLKAQAYSYHHHDQRNNVVIHHYNDDDSSLVNNNNNNNNAKSSWKNPITTVLVLVAAIASVVLLLFMAPASSGGDQSTTTKVESASSMMTASYRTTPASAYSATVSSQSSSTPDVLGMAHATTTVSTTTTATSTSSSTTTSTISTLSKRGQSLQPGRDDLAAFALAQTSPYHPLTNPTGYLVMLVAENKLMYPELAARLEQALLVEPQQQQQQSSPVSMIPQWVFDYGDMRGHVTFRTALAHMMERSWISAPVHPDQLVVQSGAGAILDSLAWVLAKEGDALLLTSPAYPAFAADFAIHGKMTPYYIPTTANHNYEPTVAELNAVYDDAVAAGHTPRIFVICQPQNPVGRIYSAAAMTRMIDWALSKKTIHVVSDEIYGNSVFPGAHVTSAAKVMWNKVAEVEAEAEHHHHHDHDHNKEEEQSSHNTTYLGDRVHIVAGLSKDWGMSGFRVGSLFTHNQELITAMGMMSYYTSVSQFTQYAMTALWDDADWVDWYLAENKRRLEATYHACTKALSRIGVTVFAETKGALFAWADFSSLLHPGQSEHDLWWELFHDARVLFTSGESCHGERPGMFRVVYSWPEGGVVAMEELGERLVQWNKGRRSRSSSSSSEKGGVH